MFPIYKPLVVLLAPFLFSLICSAEVIEKPVTFEKINDLLKKHPEITSIESLLSRIPESYRSYYTLMHSSKSLQSAEPTRPRAILYGEDAYLTMAFNSDGNTLELIQYRPDKRSFEFRVITFPKNKQDKLQVSAPNPERCLNCHGSDPRPIWEPYNRWPGAYFGRDDVIVLESENKDIQRAFDQERHNFETFLKANEKAGRYQYLVGLSDGYQPESGNSKRVKTKILHNNLFNQTVAQLNYQRIFRLMQQTPNFDKFKFAAVGALLCRKALPDFFPNELATKFKDSLAKISNEKVSFSGKGILNFFEMLGMNTDDWAMNFQSAEEPLTTPGNSMNELSAVIAKGDPDLDTLLQPKNSDFIGVPILEIKDIYSEDGRSQICANLRSKSLLALGESEEFVFASYLAELIRNDLSKQGPSIEEIEKQLRGKLEKELSFLARLSKENLNDPKERALIDAISDCVEKAARVQKLQGKLNSVKAEERESTLQNYIEKWRDAPFLFGGALSPSQIASWKRFTSDKAQVLKIVGRLLEEEAVKKEAECTQHANHLSSLRATKSAVNIGVGALGTTLGAILFKKALRKRSKCQEVNNKLGDK